MSGPGVQDSAARAAAAEPQHSILLQAPAGSGKTAVLVERFLRLLCTVEDPGQVLAITFTLKAAAEMRERVLRALRDEFAADDPTAPRLRALAQQVRQYAARQGWELLQDPAALRIQTIDAFNFWVASQLPVAARAGGTLTVTESPEALYTQAARDTLAAAQEGEELAADLDLLFERLDNHWSHVERLLADMLRERAHWLRHVLQTEPQALGERITASLARVIGAHLRRLQELLPRALASTLQSLPGIGPLGADADDLPAWQALAALALTQKGTWRQTVTARVHPEYADRARRAVACDCIEQLSRIGHLDTLLQTVQNLPPARLAAGEPQALAALSRVLTRAAQELQAQFAASGRVDYVYVAGAARAALTDSAQPTDLALRTGLALRHILVDEFQDTSIAQCELLVTLTAAWEPGDGRTLFVVGDPMQSIYRFREAEVGLFVGAREQGIGRVALQALRLTRNFRSRPALVEWTNRVFAAVFPVADDRRTGAVAYSASEPARPPQSQPAVSLQLFPHAQAEAAAVAQRIAALRAAEPQASIAVLVAAHSHAAPVVAALDALGVGSLGVDLVPLAERTVVRDLVQLMRALHDPGDRVAWLAVLRAPWCGLSLAALAALSQPDDSLLVSEALADERRVTRCPPDDQERLQRVRAVLTAAVARRECAAPTQWLERTWMQLGGPDACTAQALSDARAFFAALAEAAVSGAWRDPRDFAALLARLFSQGVAAGDNPVQIMTIHRAKGLEFAHVFVPALARRGGGDGAALLRLIDLPRAAGPAADDPDTDLLIAPVAAVGEHSDAPLSRFIARLHEERARNERARLLYVAVTRARESLHLSAAPAVRADGSVRQAPGTLLGVLWPVVGSEFETVGQQDAQLTAPPPTARTLHRLVASWQPSALAPRVAVPADLPPQATADEPEFSWVGQTQRHVGTLVHELLARSAQSLAAAVEPGVPSCEQLRERLRHMGVPSAERDAAALRVHDAVQSALRDERGRWILGSGHRQAHSELPLTGLVDGRLRSVVIDRTFIDADGIRWVIDYKTGHHAGGGLEQFLLNELARYREQLLTYAQLVRGLGPEPVRAALYFPLLGAFRQLDG